MRIVLRLLVAVLVFLAGLYIGAKWGAPEILVSTVDGVAARISEAIGGAGTAGAPTDEQSQIADEQSTAPQTAPETGPGGRIWEGTEDELIVCKTRVQNAPPSDAQGRVLNYQPLILVNGVKLLLKPATKSCLSSGFGPRNGGMHRGIDYFSDRGGNVLAAGDGIIREAEFREDYGNTLLVDHGSNVYTRYAHLASFNSGIAVGSAVSRGQVMGPIGNTGSTTVLHLHYEIRTGNYDTPAKSFGLEAIDPFGLPGTSFSALSNLPDDPDE